MIGVVLSGGQSSRMRQDKGLIKLNGETWTKIALDKLTALGLPTLVSVNERQYHEYQKYFDKVQLVVDRPDLGISGPLGGIISAHLSHLSEDLAVLACDMINLKQTVLEKLIAEFQQHQPEAIVYKSERIEPLCAIYSATALKKIYAQHVSHPFENHSIHHLLDILETTYLPLPNEWLSFFRNFNQPADLQ